MLARRASSRSKGNVTSRSRHGSVIANVTLRAAVSIAAFGKPVSVSSSPMRRESEIGARSLPLVTNNL